MKTQSWQIKITSLLKCTVDFLEKLRECFNFFYLPKPQPLTYTFEIPRGTQKCKKYKLCQKKNRLNPMYSKMIFQNALESKMHELVSYNEKHLRNSSVSFSVKKLLFQKLVVILVLTFSSKLLLGLKEKMCLKTKFVVLVLLQLGKTKKAGMEKVFALRYVLFHSETNKMGRQQRVDAENAPKFKKSKGNELEKRF